MKLQVRSPAETSQHASIIEAKAAGAFEQPTRQEQAEFNHALELSRLQGKKRRSFIDICGCEAAGVLNQVTVGTGEALRP